MNTEHRLTATRYIWVVFFFALAISNANVIMNGEALGAANVIMTMIVAIAATGTTVAVWTSHTPFSDEETSDTKLKRGERVTRLIDLMDNDELHELRQRLSQKVDDPVDNYVTLGDDGELHNINRNN
jgi:hypothetical protein